MVTTSFALLLLKFEDFVGSWNTLSSTIFIDIKVVESVLSTLTVLEGGFVSVLFLGDVLLFVMSVLTMVGVLTGASFGVLEDLVVLLRLNDDNNGFLATGGAFLCFASSERDRFSKAVFDGRSPATCLATVAASALYLRMLDFRDTTTYLRCVLLVVS